MMSIFNVYFHNLLFNFKIGFKGTKVEGEMRRWVLSWSNTKVEKYILRMT